MPYCPVIVEIKDKDESRETNLVKYYKGNYILQVYDDSGECVYEKILQCKVFAK